MTEKVELEHLLEVAAGFDTVPMLLTVDDDLRPRASAVSVTWTSPGSGTDGTTARVRAGRRSLANAARRPLASLLWPAPPGERFALFVDGEATATEPDADPREGGHVTLTPTGAMLHVVGQRQTSPPTSS